MQFRLTTITLIVGTSMLFGTAAHAQTRSSRPDDIPTTQTVETLQGTSKASDLDGGIAPATVSGQGASNAPSQQGLCQISRELSTNVEGGGQGQPPASVLPPTPGRRTLGGFPVTTRLIGSLLNQNRPREYKCST